MAPAAPCMAEDPPWRTGSAPRAVPWGRVAPSLSLRGSSPAMTQPLPATWRCLERSQNGGQVALLEPSQGRGDAFQGAMYLDAMPTAPSEAQEPWGAHVRMAGPSLPAPKVKGGTMRWRTVALLLMLGVSMGASAARLHPGAAGWHPPRGYATYEIVRPQQLRPWAGRAMAGEASYAITVEEENLVVHLRRRRGLLLPNLPVFTYSPAGDRLLEHPHVPECYYQGYVEGRPGSLVTLSTCSGLRGQLRVGNRSYGIEPVPGSLTFQHLLYRREESPDMSLTCGLTQATPRQQEGISAKLSAQDYLQRLKHTSYVEIFVVVDHYLFSFYRRNESAAVQLVVDAINLSETYYYPLKVRICLIGIEIWTHSNLIGYSQDIEYVLNNFNDWASQDLSRRMKYDLTHLFTYRDFGFVVGLAYVGSVCYAGYNTGLVTHIRGDFVIFSIIFAHELGHNLGMEHDAKYCVCGKATKCYMTGESLEDSKAFSNCSIKSFLDLLQRGDGNCLRNVPEPHRLFYYQLCGNKVIDEGEQCDCGRPLDCQRDPCCDQNCRLKPGAVCSMGRCCQKCHFRAAGHKCRKETDECDLPEYCNGTSEWCPMDFYVHDGTPCSDNGSCYQGKCATYDKQCRKIFGKEARGAPESCFKKLNMKGDRFGNCGGDGTSAAFVGCKHQNALCGRLQCANVKRIPFLRGPETIIQTPGPQGWCWGTGYHAGIDIPDIGGGLDGTKCGPQKICINKTCRDAAARKECDPKVLCHGKGVCNNLEHCHCKAGWAPPDCQFHGLGGSVDSGPPPPLSMSFSEAVQNKAFGTAIGSSIAVVLTLIALVVVVIKYRTAMFALFRRRLA